MSIGAVLIALGLLVALAGLALGFRSRAQARPALAAINDEAPIHGAGDVLERVHHVFEATDRAVRLAVVTVIAGLLIAGFGAYLSSHASGFGADVSGGGSGSR